MCIRDSNNLGLLYRDKGLVAESIREFQRALIINPQYGTARSEAGVNPQVPLD